MITERSTIPWFFNYCLGLLLLFLLPEPGRCTVRTYPAPTSEFPASPFYKVTVTQGEEKETAFVYISHARTEGPGTQFVQERTLSYTGFMATGVVTVEVERLADERLLPGAPKVRPSRWGIEPEISGERRVRFVLPRAGQYTLEFGETGYRHGLVIAYDPWETSAPDPTDAGVFSVPPDLRGDPSSELGQAHTLYFGKGMYDLGGRLELPPQIKRVYLAPGAFVYGAIYIGHSDVTVDGRGVLSSARLAHREAHTLETPPAARRVVIEGITVADYAQFAVRTLGRDNVVRWVKCVGGWIYNADGLVGWAGTTLSHNFIHADDDAIKLYDDHVTVEDCVIWQMTNGACLQLGWQSLSARQVRVRNIDVIRTEWRNNGGANNSVINLRLASGGENGKTQRDFIFENIYVETPVDRFLDLRFRDKKKGREDGGAHRLLDFTFRNIHVRMTSPNEHSGNLLLPYNAAYGYENIRFEDLYINGLKITKDNYREAGYFKMPDEVKLAISFE
ncbi:hypothetical protein [Flavilitoribacter nigricans]|uniref:Endo-polygalacturonase n=1 Tax=Flavilitoribacter nigricans (strain ATCC 23147 / DSM 23189 / NBRC 102662 / NCIMB 1420 / SS-2) TaxID=1122177 RepID=A0A2D0N0Z8_FLAN2|nr:hypothetical protein [Flavilitoribacter nigricans]PHN02137.1 hypothetical protein CRP01_33650 [Flavilitoribacter nigricans DSM 23189 = NBRC 102662]